MYSTQNKTQQLVTSVKMKTRTRQPQGVNYGIDIHGNPIPEFNNFLTIPTLAAFIRFYSLQHDALFNKLITCSIISNSVSHCSLYLFAKNNNLIIDNITDNLFPKQVQIIPTLLKLIHNANIEFQQNLKQCSISKTRYIIVRLNLILAKSQMKLLENDTCHATNIVICVNKKQVSFLSLETSISGSNENYKKFEKIIYLKIEKILKTFSGFENIKYISFANDCCTLINIQKDTKLCMFFSTYTCYLYLVNGNRKKIYEYLNDLTINARTKLLAQFLFFIYKHSCETVDLNIETDKKVYKQRAHELISAWS